MASSNACWYFGHNARSSEAPAIHSDCLPIHHLLHLIQFQAPSIQPLLVAFPGVVGIQWLDSRVRLGNLEWPALTILEQAWPGKFAYIETLFQEPAA